MDSKVLEILACPVCKGSLVYKKEQKELICKRDLLAYRIEEGVPIMLEEEARALSDEELAKLR